MTKETHLYKDIEFTLVCEYKRKKSNGLTHHIHVMFKTVRGTWDSEIDVSEEMMQETQWRDTLCAESLMHYENRTGLTMTND